MTDKVTDIERKLIQYRDLTHQLHLLREHKKFQDLQYAESVDKLMKQMYDLELGYTGPTTQKCCKGKCHTKNEYIPPENQIS